MNEQSQIVGGALVGALIGAATTYLFFTEGGRGYRGKMESAIDELRRDFGRFQKTIEKLGVMANEGLRAVDAFQAARAETFPVNRTSH